MASRPSIVQWQGNPSRHNLSRRTGGAAAIKYVACHYTAGTGSAKNNCTYFSGGNRNASADFFVDTDGTIYQFSPDLASYYTWAVGDGRGKYGITNSNSVSIEMVNAGGPFAEAQVNALAALVQWLMGAYGVPADRVVRHYDASRKQCPLYYADAARWKQLHARITGGTVTSTPTNSATTVTSTVTNSGNKLTVDGLWGENTTLGLQRLLGTTADGKVSSQYSGNRQYLPAATSGWYFQTNPSGSQMVMALQRLLGVTADGIMGPTTIKALQRRLGVTADGYCGAVTVRALQTAINNGKL